MSQKRSIGGKNSSVSDNENIVLDKARQLGLLTPERLTTNFLQELIDFKSKVGKVITKTYWAPLQYDEGDYWIPMYTEEITDSIIEKLPPKFGISYFQEKIDKKYELRVFYLKGEFYTMAIFSQQDEQTQVDFRKYNHKKPNRTVPFKLHKEIDNKLDKLMDSLDLDCGSIDIVVDKNNNYYFLEVNPVGQFGMTSYPCNYYLEKRIAKYLAGIK